MPKQPDQPEQGSFHIEQEVHIRASREKVWPGLLDVQSWWCHSFADASVRMALEPFAGGRFYEDSDEGVKALFGTVTYIKAPEVIRLSGPLGMNRLPLTSVYEWRLDPSTDGRSTTLKLTHRAIGLLDPEWEKSHNEGWQQLWPHLKALIEDGKRLRP
jgi:uncharacterized protein YndB with AHSA1/START domain